ncbi:AMP-binding enzyme [Paenibacillus glucanolyticus]|uniref:AMP-binding enzyme n=1 Tax=Paenibacillus glucanolyticus TaxID=59843 RepID=UPI0034CFB581
MLSNEAVSAAVVLYHETGGRAYISGHVVLSKGDHCPNEEQLKAQLKEKLPDYMIPNSITIYNRFPTTLNGKTNKEQLKLLAEQ